MLSFYRKLDLLNRIYIINFCKLELLEKTHIWEVPKELENFDFKRHTYLNEDDTKLLVATLPKKRIKFIIDKIILDIIKQDEEIAVNSQLLRELNKYFPPKEIKQIFKNNLKTNEFKFFTNAIISYGILDVFYHLIKTIFHDVENKLGISILDRFNPKYQVNENLIRDIQKLSLDSLLENTVALHLPYLKNI